jgi:hypothetical protein
MSMTLRDRWAETLYCRHCETIGNAEFSRASSFDSTLESVPDGFRAVAGEYGASFYCTACESLVEQ